ncbi:B12-binding domain-containing radical SAM protein [Candidatus Altiarchaeota archaeon]
MKIVVCNSVGITTEGQKLSTFPSRWTGMDGTLTGQTFYPFELGYLSTLLKRDTDHDIKFLDGVLNRWDFDRYYDELSKEKPDIMVMEPSSMTYAADIKLANKMKEKFGTKIIITGQHATAFPEEVSEQADYVCIGEYEFTVLDIIQGIDPKQILGLYPNERRPLLDINSLPWPEDEDTRRIEYSEPIHSEYNEVEMFASRGCPMSCIFCAASTVYYNKPNWRPRNIDDIIAEIKYLRKKYPEMEGVFFDEEDHNANKKFILDLTKAIKDNKLDDLHYNVMTGYWTMDAEMLEAMYSAGYYKLRIGIETGSPKIAEELHLGAKFNLERLEKVLKVARKIGLKIQGTFTIGGKGSDPEEDMKTVKLLKNLIENDLITEYQISICTPQPGTPFYKWSDENGYLVTKDWSLYDGSQCSVVSYPHYSNKEIEDMFQYARQTALLARIKHDARQQGYLRTIYPVFRTSIRNRGVVGTFVEGAKRMIHYLSK